jgi:hypothetical protein
LGHADFIPVIERAGRLARRLKDGDLMADAALATIFPGGFFTAAGRTVPGLIELCEDAIELLDDGDPRMPRIMATLVAHLTFDPDRERRLDLVGRAHRLASDIGDPELIGTVLSAEFIALWDPTTYARRVEIAEAVSRMARASGDGDLEFLGGLFSAFCAAERGDAGGARERMRQLEPTVESSRNFYFRFLVDRLSVTLDILSDKPGMQVEIDALAARYADTHADTAGTWAVQTGTLAFQSGRLGTMVDPIREMVSGSTLSANWTAAYGLALLANGDLDAAAAVLDGCPPAPLDYVWITTKQVLAELAAGLGRVEMCDRLLSELMPFRGQLGITSSGAACYGLVSRTLGLLALAARRPELAIELLDEAVAHADAIVAPFEATSTRRLLAEALLATGQRGDEVDSIVAAAGVLAAEHGFTEEQRHLAALVA